LPDESRPKRKKLPKKVIGSKKEGWRGKKDGPLLIERNSRLENTSGSTTRPPPKGAQLFKKPVKAQKRIQGKTPPPSAHPHRKGKQKTFFCDEA